MVESSKKKPFSLLVKPASADCNLSCAYCFYLERSSLYPYTRRRRMKDEVLERMISTYMATEQPQYSFGWQGGEPTLMGLEFFRRVIELQKKYGRPGSVVANGVQTNGTLIDDELAEHFALYNFLLGVSLDGPKKIHNAYRNTQDGRGSHASVLKGIGVLKKHHVEFNILIAVNSSNVKKPTQVYRYLLDLGVYYHQYIPIVEFDGQGSPLPFTIHAEEWGEFLCELFDEWFKSDTERVSIRLFDAILAYLVDGSQIICRLGNDCRQYFVVEHNGDIYPCDFFVDSDKFLGNICSTDWQELLESPRYRGFGVQKSKINTLCTECPYLELCSGDCLKHRFYGSPPGQKPEQLSWLCEGWKIFFGHTLARFKKCARSIQKRRKQEALRERFCYQNFLKNLDLFLIGERRGLSPFY